MYLASGNNPDRSRFGDGGRCRASGGLPSPVDLPPENDVPLASRLPRACRLCVRRRSFKASNDAAPLPTFGASRILATTGLHPIRRTGLQIARKLTVVVRSRICDARFADYATRLGSNRPSTPTANCLSV